MSKVLPEFHRKLTEVRKLRQREDFQHCVINRDHVVYRSARWLGSAISDGHLVVFFPHLVVDAEFQGQGIGGELMRRLMAKYQGFHQQILLADGRALDFYTKLGVSRAGQTELLWIFDGHERMTDGVAKKGAGRALGCVVFDEVSTMSPF